MNVEKALMELTKLTVGCTDVGAIGYAAAIARDLLRQDPVEIKLTLSHEIYKNAKNVGVPGTGERGPRVAALLGTAINNPSQKLAIFHKVDKEEVRKLKNLQKTVEVSLFHGGYDTPLWVEVEMLTQEDCVRVILAYDYDYVYRVIKNDVLVKENLKLDGGNKSTSVLNLHAILAIANGIEEPIPHLIERIATNVDVDQAVPEDKALFLLDLHRKIYQKTAQRMRGDVLPIVSFCGSGNLGIASAISIEGLTRFYRVNDLEKTRATVVYLLIVQAIKEQMTLLTVMCGTAIAAGAAAAGVNLYLKGKDASLIHYAVNQALSESLGILCDGAKENCAAKTASRVLEGILQSEYVAEDQGIYGDQGIVVDNPNETIHRIASLNNEAMESLNQALLAMI
jgi:L-cysteine desulfidase